MKTWADVLCGRNPGGARRQPDATIPTAHPRGGTPYGRAALSGEVAKLRGAGKGERNHTLNKAAFAAGQLVAGGELSEFEALRALAEAAKACGLGEREIAATLRSGLSSGLKYPRRRPRGYAVLEPVRGGRS